MFEVINLLSSVPISSIMINKENNTQHILSVSSSVSTVLVLYRYNKYIPEKNNNNAVFFIYFNFCFTIFSKVLTTFNLGVVSNTSFSKTSFISCNDKQGLFILT